MSSVMTVAGPAFTSTSASSAFAEMSFGFRLYRQARLIRKSAHTDEKTKQTKNLPASLKISEVGQAIFVEPASSNLAKKEKKEKQTNLKKAESPEPAEKITDNLQTFAANPASPTRPDKRGYDAESAAESSDPALKIRLTGAVPTVQLTLDQAVEKPAVKEEMWTKFGALFNGQRTAKPEEVKAFLRLSEMS
ncbi:unnamed protein product [Bursaphelenchus okinawaensis]|uniref:Uncharacterized protein n=1 Tax=Bursaphelenchus okinawaensis TaxID=465554 RepID=A0A811JVH5_9BILA|nr:unnamed protein product [Bursaphelenchus okinawaensis]CAG9085004.1 unnamed protein product [Bursaphelenchus okinawaensis]